MQQLSQPLYDLQLPFAQFEQFLIHPRSYSLLLFESTTKERGLVGHWQKLSIIFTFFKNECQKRELYQKGGCGIQKILWKKLSAIEIRHPTACRPAMRTIPRPLLLAATST